jgi:hypothetical protein
MRLELAERLVCPRDHAPTPLVVVAQRVVGRDLHAGLAGCAECRLEARVTLGVVEFPEPAAAASPASAEPLAPSSERIERTAALLSLAEPGGTILLTGRYTSLAARLAEEYDLTAVIPATDATVPTSDRIVRIKNAEAHAVFSDQTFRAAALDPPTPAALRSLAIGARVLAPADAPTLPDTRELARDQEEWLAERTAATPIIQLGRR